MSDFAPNYASAKLGESEMVTGKQLFSKLADGKLIVEIVTTNYSDPVGNQVLVQM